MLESDENVPPRARAVPGTSSQTPTRLSLQKSLGNARVVTPFDARRATRAIVGADVVTFDDITAMIRDASTGERDPKTGAQVGVDVDAFARALERRASEGHREKKTEAVTSDALMELARELLPEYGGGTERGKVGVEAAPSARAVGARETRDAGRDTREMEEVDRTQNASGALTAASETLASVRAENDSLRAALAKTRAANEDLQRCAESAEARENEARAALRECMISLHHESVGRERLRVELTKANEELQRCRESAESAVATELALEARIKHLRNGDLVSALRERLIESQNELKAEIKASDMARRRFAREKMRIDSFVMRLRDKARTLGICLELLEVDDDASASESDD